MATGRRGEGTYFPWGLAPAILVLLISYYGKNPGAGYFLDPIQKKEIPAQPLGRIGAKLILCSLQGPSAWIASRWAAVP